MAELGKEGVLFDSFSESNSKEGSLRAGNNVKLSPVLGARLQACLEDVAAARQSTAAEAGVPHVSITSGTQFVEHFFDKLHASNCVCVRSS